VATDRFGPVAKLVPINLSPVVDLTVPETKRAAPSLSGSVYALPSVAVMAGMPNSIDVYMHYIMDVAP
jgi:hypothetical protein